VSAPSCPGCGSPVVYDLACHTWPQRRDDGTERWMACLPCDSAVRYMCDGPDTGEGYPDEGCGWSYVHGLNPRNPRATANEESRPSWLPGPSGGNAVPGCRMFGEDRVPG
jgi:hypothetical protein